MCVEIENLKVSMSCSIKLFEMKVFEVENKPMLFISYERLALMKKLCLMLNCSVNNRKLMYYLLFLVHCFAWFLKM